MLTPSSRRGRAPGLDAAPLLAEALLAGAAPASAADVTTVLFVPIVLSNTGANGASYTSELVLTNRGTSTARSSSSTPPPSARGTAR